MSDLFSSANDGDDDMDDAGSLSFGGGAGEPSSRPRSPLAVRMRPRSLDEVVGQQHLLGPGSPLQMLAAGGSAGGPAGPASVMLWGPPGTGKTTLAHVIARGPGRKFVELSAITAGVKDVRRVMDQALTDRDLHGRTTVLFLDEIHRFNKAQQDALLPGVENRWVVLIAATTENPSFSVVAPLLSRSILLTLLGRLSYLQVEQGAAYSKAASANRIRSVISPAAIHFGSAAMPRPASASR